MVLPWMPLWPWSCIHTTSNTGLYHHINTLTPERNVANHRAALSTAQCIPEDTVCLSPLKKIYAKNSMNSFIHSDHFYSASSSPLLLRGASDTAWILCRNFTLKHHRQLWVKDLSKVPTWRLERESSPWPLGRNVSTLPMRRTCPKILI